MSNSSRTPLLIIFITVFIDLLGFGIVLPLLPRYAAHFEASGRTLGLLMASFSAMQFLFAPLWGRVSDRVGRRPILILGLAGSTFFYSVFGYATSLGVDGRLFGLGVLPWLFICRIGAGIAGATIPTAQAYIADVTGPQERAKGMALIGAAFGIGFTFGPLLGWAFLPAAGEGAQSVPSSAPGYVASVLSGLAMLSAIFLLPESLQPGAIGTARQWFDVSSFKRAIVNPAMALILFTIFLTTFAFGQFESTLSLLTSYLGLTDNDNYVCYAYVGFVLTLSQGLIVRRVVPRLGEVMMCRAGTALMTLGLVLIGLSARENSTKMLYWVLPIVVVGFSSVTPSLQSLLSRHTSAADQGGVLGVGQSMSALARILGPWLGMTLIGDDVKRMGETIAWPYWTGAGMMALSILLTLVLRRPSDAQGSSDEIA